jgi:hypothetical protein
MTTGTSQNERFPPALADGYFRVDELPFEDRVAMTATLARQLRFVDLDNREAGDWRAMFASDATMVLARIASIDVQALQEDFLHDVDSAPLPRLAHQVVELAQWIDLWFKSLDGRDDAASQAFRERIHQLVDQQLGAELQWVHGRFGHRAWQGREVGRAHERLAGIWSSSAPLLATAAAGRDERELLRERYFVFLSAIDALRALARELLPGTLHTGTHEAAVGLLIAFLKVYESAQREVNRFTARHVDFYYRDCLGFGPAGPVADEVHLACARDARGERLLNVPQGTVFDAGKDAAGQPLRFHSAAPLVVTDARVAALCTLRMERDGRISPECEFGFVTRAKAARPPIGVADGTSAWPLFGGGAGAVDARLGLAIASPLLLLREGERTIRVELPLGEGAGDDSGTLDALVDAVTFATDPVSLRDAFGRLLGHWLLSGRADFSDAQLRRMRLAAHRELEGRVPQAHSLGDPLVLLAGPQAPQRVLVFEQLFHGLLKLHLSAANGWLEATDADVDRLPEGGLSITLRLRPDVPAIVGCDPAVHGVGWTTRLPVLRIELGTQGRLYPYSLLADRPLAEARLRVSASGVRDVVLHNNLGRLDPTKAFLPFGPLPTLSSYLVVGAREVACKNIQRLSMEFEWGGLPPDAGGFDTHYRGYPDEQRRGDFSAALAILRDGLWQPCTGASAHQPLFAPPDAAGCLQPMREIEVDPGSVRKHSRAGDPAEWDAPLPRNGLYRLQLTGPRGAFGHAAYPMVLADTVTGNARKNLRARWRQPLPNPPYTPLIERLTLSYEAAGVIRPGAQGPEEATGDVERLLHLHPFGVETLHSAAAGASHGLLPRPGDDGNLYIGLAASDPGGTLTLLFSLLESAADATRSGAVRAPVRWATLAGDHWRPLPPARVLADSTEGFLTSGIVTLDLPGDLTLHNQVMPAGLYWLRASAGAGFEGFAALRSVQAHALRARRVLPPDAAMLAILPQGRITRSLASLPGLSGVQQVGPSFGLRPAEDAGLLYTRAGERLQHKQRASTAWDVERLLLARFPEVFKVRCLSGDEIAAAGQPRPPAGQVLAVVVPQVPRNDPAFACAAPRFNAIELRRMADYLRERSSPFAKVVVRNPVYDRLQLRCTVGLVRGVHEGEALQRITRTVVATLSPWFDDGCGPAFDWVVRGEDLEARLRALDGVEYVTQLSLLHVTCSDDGVYTLADTARGAADDAARGHAVSRAPWSLVLPMPQHIVTAAPAFPASAVPLPTGIDQLSIGSTFVIGASTAAGAGVAHGGVA